MNKKVRTPAFSASSGQLLTTPQLADLTVPSALFCQQLCNYSRCCSGMTLSDFIGLISM